MIKRKVMICDVCGYEIIKRVGYKKMQSHTFKWFATQEEISVSHVCETCFHKFEQFVRGEGAV